MPCNNEEELQQQYDFNLRETTIVCALCEEGFSTSDTYFLHIYRQHPRTWQRLGLRFKCHATEKCMRQEFRTADDCDRHVESHSDAKQHCGVYVPDALRPSMFVRCSKFSASLPSSRSHHKQKCHSAVWCAEFRGEKARRCKRLGISPPPKPKPSRQRWLLNVVPLTPPPSPPPPPPPTPPTPELSYPDFPDDAAYDASGPYAPTSYGFHYAAPVPTYPTNVDDDVTLTAPATYWATTYSGTYPHPHSSTPSLSSTSSSSHSSRASTCSPMSTYSPSTGSFMGDSFPSSPAFGVNLYGQPSLQGYGHPSYAHAYNFDGAAVTSVTESVSPYSGAVMGSDPSSLFDTLALNSYNSLAYPQISPNACFMYPPSEYSHGIFDSQQY